MLPEGETTSRRNSLQRKSGMWSWQVLVLILLTPSSFPCYCVLKFQTRYSSCSCLCFSFLTHYIFIICYYIFITFLFFTLNYDFLCDIFVFPYFMISVDQSCLETPWQIEYQHFWMYLFRMHILKADRSLPVFVTWQTKKDNPR